MTRTSLSIVCLGIVGLVACDLNKGLDECDDGTVLDAETGDCIPDGDDGDTDEEEEEEDTDLSHMWRDSFTGTVTVDSIVEGNSICAATVSLVGTRFTGDCANCDFAFDIEATIESRVPESCSVSPFYTWWLDPEDFADSDIALHMAHADPYMGYYGSYDDALLFGYTAIEDGYTYGPYFEPVASNGSFSRTGDDISWSIDSESEDVTYYYADSECDPQTDVSFEAGTAALAGNFTTAGSLPCPADGDESALDVYTITLAGAGDVTITVDTVAADSTFDPYFWINDSAECIVSGADDSFDCSFPPPEYQCPSGTFSGVAGTFQVVVGTYGGCEGTTSDYEITVGAAVDPSLTLVEDDALAYSVSVVNHLVIGSGALSAE